MIAPWEIDWDKLESEILRLLAKESRTSEEEEALQDYIKLLQASGRRG